MKIHKISQFDDEDEEVVSGPLLPFTKDDLYSCWQYYTDYFIDILNGEYDLDEARKDLRGLIGSKWDERNVK